MIFWPLISLTLNNVLHTTQSLTPIFTPGYWILSLSPGWYFLPSPLLHMANSASTTLILRWKPWFLFYGLQKQTKKPLPQTTWLPLLMCIITTYLLSSHHHYGSIIPIITVDPSLWLLIEQLFLLSTTSHPLSPS